MQHWLNELWLILFDRWQTATFKPLAPQDWGVGSVLLLGYAALAIPWGFRGKLLTWKVVRDPGAIASTLLIAFIFPAGFEETLFRVLLLPLPGENRFYAWAVLGLILFVLAHPLNAQIFFPHRKATFFNPIFLALAGSLGLVCTLGYAWSGSLWLPLMLHWIPVVIWLLFLGGSDRMQSSEDRILRTE